MQTLTSRYLCRQNHFTVNIEMLDVYACYCILCQKRSGGIAMYLKASIHPLMSPESAELLYFPSSNHDEWFFCSGRGCPLWLTLTNSDRYFIPWTFLELNEVDRRHLILVAEIYTETQPMFWGLMGQYA